MTSILWLAGLLRAGLLAFTPITATYAQDRIEAGSASDGTRADGGDGDGSGDGGSDSGSGGGSGSGSGSEVGNHPAFNGVSI